MEKTKIKDNFNTHIDFFNKNIKDTFFTYFLSDEICPYISKQQDIVKKYLRQHFVKSFNLLLSIIILTCANQSKPLADEGKIIFRSLFENIINFLFIFYVDNGKKPEKLVQQFYDYTLIAKNSFAKKILNPSSCTDLTSPVYKMVKGKVEEDDKDVNILELEKQFKNKYKIKNCTTWSGISIKSMLEKIEKSDFLKEFIFYKKYYFDGNAYVHCNILEYVDENETLIENTDKIDHLKLIHSSIFLFLAYAECYFGVIGINIKEKFKQTVEQYEILAENYDDLISKAKIKVMYY